MTQFYWNLRLLTRNRAFSALIFLYVTAACLAIFIGHQRHEKQISQRAQVDARYQEELDHWRSKEEPLEAGYVGYYQFIPTSADLSTWTALFSGEYAEHNWHLRVRLLALYGQTYAGEIQHYDHWILGHFDLGFVWIYLLPVIIGLLCVNMIADEKSSGRWPLLRAQTKSTHHFLVSRLKVNFLVLTLLNIGLLFIATIALGIPVDTTWGTVLSLLVVYQLFWFATAALIARSERNATFNVLTYCSIWLVAALALPGMHYLSHMNSEEMNLGIAVLMEQREQMNDSWDRDKNADFAKFLEQNPHWRDTGPLPDTFRWKWYFAMQNMSDAAAQDYVDQLRTLRLDAYRSASTWAWLSPVMSVQNTLTSIAGTGGVMHQQYLDQVSQFHGELQEFFYPHYFFDAPFSVDRLDDIPSFTYERIQPSATQGLVQLGIVNLILMGLFFYRRPKAKPRNPDDADPIAPATLSSRRQNKARSSHRTSPVKTVE